MDPYHRNQAQHNISKDEFQALKELIRLQREQKIKIKLCDKGAGIIVTNFNDYIETCMKHLNSKQNGTNPYYEEVNESSVEDAITDFSQQTVYVRSCIIYWLDPDQGCRANYCNTDW